MDVELTEVKDFLASHAPFSDLPKEVLRTLPGELTARYYRRGSVLCALGEHTKHLFILRSGAVDLHDNQGTLYERCEEGQSMGITSLIDRAPSTYSFTAREDSLVLLMPDHLFHRLCADEPVFRQHYLRRKNRVREGVQAMHASRSGAILKTHLREILPEPMVAVTPDTSVVEAVRLMADHTVSGILVVEDNRLVGVFTDHDLRVHVVSAGHSLSLPIRIFMTDRPISVSDEALAFEALLEMVSRNIDHIPVLRNGVPVGMVTSRDLMRLEHTNPIYLAGDIAKQRGVEGLVKVSRRRNKVVEQLVAQDASADDIGRVVTAIGDQVTRRLLQLGQAELGEPPVPYCWIALGSQGRLEQGPASDQDHGLILDDSVRPEHADYFVRLADFVAQGLAAAGYPLCLGDVMATNPRWRRPLAMWRQQFRHWIVEPDAEALLGAQIFFDLRPVHGALHMGQSLIEQIAREARHHPRFLTHLASQAVSWQPPLGFFRKFVVEKEGEHASTFDIKAYGIGPIVQIARVLALSRGLPQVNTKERLIAARDAGAINEETTEDLLDSLEFIGYVRLKHQTTQSARGATPDNHIPPADLSSFDRRHLRDAFQVVRKQQQQLAFLHKTHLL
ncbi:MAG: DUF294 nucleotidyltransferase-like domain-containing protein [Propionibacteriaceae bacterium]|nr:DUF294 nucleotidyltransferase-like domain-containing protein [Propionibacteriaceae bacterium]